MKTALLGAAFAAALWTPTAATQATPQSPSAGAQPRTITGCVAPGADATTFTITESASAARSAPADPSGAKSSAYPATWSLKADSNVDLSKYVGKKVEITGSSDHKGGASADTSASSTRADASMTGPRFHVKSVKVIAENCS
jgi:hypothetical protein